MSSTFTSHTENFWNDRYGNDEFAYGTAPNEFLLSQQARLPASGRALAVGDGEGRNGVWLAQQGLSVLSVDLAAAGLQKARALAQQNDVTLETKQADLSDWDWPVATYDVVVSIYLHFPSDLRPRMHRAMLQALKPGGILMLEAFAPNQLDYQKQYQSGGPPRLDMLYAPDMLREDLAGAEEVMLAEAKTKLQEGAYHAGPAAVVRAVFRKSG